MEYTVERTKTALLATVFNTVAEHNDHTDGHVITIDPESQIGRTVSIILFNPATRDALEVTFDQFVPGGIVEVKIGETLIQDAHTERDIALAPYDEQRVFSALETVKDMLERFMSAGR